MTSTPSTPDEHGFPEYPGNTPAPGELDKFSHDWRILDAEKEIECKQISLDTFQLRSSTHVVTVDKEGFQAYISRDRGPWVDWLLKNNVKSVPRVD